MNELGRTSRRVRIKSVFSLDLSGHVTARSGLAGLTTAGRNLIIIRVQDASNVQPDVPALPLRSMVGQLPLEQHIGVRIPEGQPIMHFPALSRPFLHSTFHAQINNLTPISVQRRPKTCDASQLFLWVRLRVSL